MSIVGRDVQHLKVETVENGCTKVTRDWHYVSYKGETRSGTIVTTARATSTDKYSKRVGIIVAILKAFGYSKRVVNLVCDILLKEEI